MKSIFAGMILGFLLSVSLICSGFMDKIYQDGMFSDDSILQLIPEEKQAELLRVKVRNSYARYNDGSEAFIFNGKKVPFVAIHSGLWDESGTKVHGSSLSMSMSKGGKASGGSGLVIHSIDGKLYAYSSGDVRDNPENFREILLDVVNSTIELSEDMKNRG